MHGSHVGDLLEATRAGLANAIIMRSPEEPASRPYNETLGIVTDLSQRFGYMLGEELSARGSTDMTEEDKESHLWNRLVGANWGLLVEVLAGVPGYDRHIDADDTLASIEAVTDELVDWYRDIGFEVRPCRSSPSRCCAWTFKWTRHIGR